MALIQIIQDTVPNHPTNMQFYSAFGEFVLDDPEQNDNDGVGRENRFSPPPGSYNVSQSTSGDWRLLAINCLPAQNAVVDHSADSVTLTVKAGDSVVCTFITQSLTVQTVTPSPIATSTPQPATPQPATPQPSTPTPTHTTTPTASSTVVNTPTATQMPTIVKTPTPASTPNTANCPVFEMTDPLSLTTGEQFAQSQLEVSGAPLIADVNVLVRFAHPYVGDLSLKLIHQESGREVTLLNRPGVPPLNFGCKYDDIAAVFSDEATLDAETVCEPSTPTLNGAFLPAEELSTFDGVSGDGTWVLDIIDHDPFADTGTLVEWKLQLCSDAAQPGDMRLLDNQSPLVQGRAATNHEDKEDQAASRQLFLPFVVR